MLRLLAVPSLDMTRKSSFLIVIPGSPTYLGKAAKHQVTLPKHGMHWEFTGRNAVLGEFRFEA